MPRRRLTHAQALKSLFDHLNGRWTLAVLCPGVAGPALREEQDAYERASEEEKKGAQPYAEKEHASVWRFSFNSQRSVTTAPLSLSGAVLEAKRAIAVDKIANHYARIGFKQASEPPRSAVAIIHSALAATRLCWDFTAT